MKTNLEVVSIVLAAAIAVAATIKVKKKKKYFSLDEELDDSSPDPTAG